MDGSDAPLAKITHVIFDLDGTLLDTESLVEEVTCQLVERHGATWRPGGAEACLGQRPLEAARAVVAQFQLACSPEDFLQQSLLLLQDRWQRAKALPGADRLIGHLLRCGVPLGLASNSPRKNITAKLSFHPVWAEAFDATLAGDEVQNGKPDPEIFLTVARKLGADPASTLVIEDSPAGVQAGKAAGMHVLAVPSLPKKSSRPLYQVADQIAGSLLDVRPELWGLPPFTDWVREALPLPPWCVAGPVVKGFGRGSKVLGIPTANLPASSLGRQLAEHSCGIYLGWAALEGRGVFKMVMSVGWNPFFDNPEKTIEPWLLHEFGEDFYGEELRLVVVGYIRPEADFTTLEALVARIRKDGEIAKVALDVHPYSKFATDPFLTEPTS